MYEFAKGVALRDLGVETIPATFARPLPQGVRRVVVKVEHLSVIVRQILEGLLYMHRLGLAHNDINPNSKSIQ